MEDLKQAQAELEQAKAEMAELLEKDGSTGNEAHRERVKTKIDRDPDMDTFNDHEVLEYALFQVIPRGDTKPAARELLNAFGSVAGVLDADLQELMAIKGIGEKAARMLKCCMILARRAEKSRNNPGVAIRTPDAAARFMYPLMIDKLYEQVCMLSLDVNDRALQMEVLNKGESDSAKLEIGKVVAYAYRRGAKSVILAHNHPAGTLYPSVSDIEMTSRCALVCKAAGIRVLDHLIFSKGKYFSFRGNGHEKPIYTSSNNLLKNLPLQETSEIFRKIYMSGLLETPEDELEQEQEQE